MANRPSTAASVISSTFSDDPDTPRQQPPLSALPQRSQPPPAQHGYTHEAGPARTTPRSSLVGGRSTAMSSRPQSPASTVSRTHVPSLTAQGFFKPMSSQRLQAQRLGRPNTARTGLSMPATDELGDGETETRRSISTTRTRHGPYAPMPEHERAPPSRGTEFTDPVIEDRTTNASPIGNTTNRSLGDSLQLLNERNNQQQSQSRPRPQNLNLSRITQEQPPKSPLSFRSNFSLSSKRREANYGHQHLSSNGTSVRESGVHVSLPDELEHEYKSKDIRRLQQGKNHEYFQGNTIFYLGGRIQNARDRPINIITGVVLILPAILFFVFSLVMLSVSIILC